MEIGAVAVIETDVDRLAGGRVAGAAGVDAVQALRAWQQLAAGDGILAVLTGGARDNAHAHIVLALDQVATAQALLAVAVVVALALQRVPADVFVCEAEAQAWSHVEAVAPVATGKVVGAARGLRITLTLAFAFAALLLPVVEGAAEEPTAGQGERKEANERESESLAHEQVYATRVPTRIRATVGTDAPPHPLLARRILRQRAACGSAAAGVREGIVRTWATGAEARLLCEDLPPLRDEPGR